MRQQLIFLKQKGNVKETIAYKGNKKREMSIRERRLSNGNNKSAF